jgi:hypothetical protein
MARLTVAQLVSQLEASNVAYQVLEAKYDASRHDANFLNAECDTLRAELEVLRNASPVKQPVAQRWVRRAPSLEAQLAHDQYVATLMAAREQAMRSGKSVRIGGR